MRLSALSRYKSLKNAARSPVNLSPPKKIRSDVRMGDATMLKEARGEGGAQSDISATATAAASFASISARIASTSSCETK